MDAHLRELGLEFIQRFPALDGATLTVPAGEALSPAQLGCLRSHRTTLAAAPADAAVLILEDDVTLSPQIRQALPALLAALSERQLDLIFLECHPNARYALPLAAMYQEFLACMPDLQRMELPAAARRRFSQLRLIDGAHYMTSAAAYLVSPIGRQKLMAAMDEICQQRLMLNDLIYYQCIQQGVVRAAIVMPYLARANSKLFVESDTPDDGSAGYNPVALRLLNLLRHQLFAGAIDECRALLAHTLPFSLPALDADLFYETLAYYLREKRERGFFLGEPQGSG